METILTTEVLTIFLDLTVLLSLFEKKNKSTSECKDTERDVSWTKRRADKMRFDGVSKRLSSIFCAILTESD